MEPRNCSHFFKWLLTSSQIMDYELVVNLTWDYRLGHKPNTTNGPMEDMDDLMLEIIIHFTSL